MESISFRRRRGTAVVPSVSRSIMATQRHPRMIACGLLLIALTGCDGSTVEPQLVGEDASYNRAGSTLIITPATAEILVGETVQLSASSSSVQWSSSAPDVATVSSSGLVSGIAAGSVTITAKDRNKTATAAITVMARSSNPVTCSDHTFTRLVNVSTAAQLTKALEAAEPGDMIQMADGQYTGFFKITISGTPERGIALCGSRNAVLSTGSISNGTAIMLFANYWKLEGFSVTNSLVGIGAERANHNVLRGLAIYKVGQAAVHLRVFSTRNIVERSIIRDTGLHNPEYGEGVYLGSWNGHWCARTNCEPDQSDYNQVLDNVFGPNVSAEHVDAKEGTMAGTVRGNTFDGRGMVQSTPHVDAWVTIFGNGYTVSDNSGSVSLKHGYETEVVLKGWGSNNTFANNVADVQASGYGFILREGTSGNVLRCDNTVRNAASGFANVPCS